MFNEQALTLQHIRDGIAVGDGHINPKYVVTKYKEVSGPLPDEAIESAVKQMNYMSTEKDTIYIYEENPGHNNDGVPFMQLLMQHLSTGERMVLMSFPPIEDEPTGEMVGNSRSRAYNAMQLCILDGNFTLENFNWHLRKFRTAVFRSGWPKSVYSRHPVPGTNIMMNLVQQLC